MWRIFAFAVTSVVLAFTSASAQPNFDWPKDRDAVPNEQTAVQISVSIFCGQLKQFCKDRDDLVKRLSAFRYRTSDLKHDPKGDAWFVGPSAEQEARFSQECRGSCIGGDLYTMAISAQDGRVLEFYLPQ